MRTLYLDIQEGFENDTLFIYINEQEVQRLAKATTKRMLGLVRTLEIPISPGTNDLMVKVVNRGVTGHLRLEEEGDLFIGVSMQQDTLQFTVARDRFNYL